MFYDHPTSGSQHGTCSCQQGHIQCVTLPRALPRQSRMCTRVHALHHWQSMCSEGTLVTHLSFCLVQKTLSAILFFCKFVIKLQLHELLFTLRTACKQNSSLHAIPELQACNTDTCRSLKQALRQSTEAHHKIGYDCIEGAHSVFLPPHLSETGANATLTKEHTS